MKKILTIALLLAFNVSFGQSIPVTKTYYSKTENGSIGKEEMTFYLSNSYMDKTDNYYGTKSHYGPLYLHETGYTADGFYFEHFNPNIKSDPFKFTGKELIAYKILYSTKGGSLLLITEIKVVNKQAKYKIYYTNDGYDVYTSKSKKLDKSIELKENDFDVNDVVINSTSINQIMSKINFSFEQDGDKQLSKDSNYVSVRYKNGSQIQSVITYTKSGEVKQIALVMPILNVDYIKKELIKRYGTKYVNGEEVIQRGDLTYDIISEGKAGAIVIY